MPNPYGNVKHGLRHHPLYSFWKNIQSRTMNPNNPKYSIYGPHTGRGLYDEWLLVEKFIEYVSKNPGPRPSPRHSIDRIDNSKGYFPGNIRWATYREQAANQRHMSAEDNRALALTRTRDKFGRFA